MQFVLTPKQNNVAVTYTTRRATWTMRDGWVHGGFWIDLTSAGTNNTAIEIDVTSITDGDQYLPLPLSRLSGEGAIGTFEYVTSGGTRYWGELQWKATADVLVLRASGSSGTTSFLGQTPTFAVANGDSVSGQFFYEAE